MESGPALGCAGDDARGVSAGTAADLPGGQARRAANTDSNRDDWRGAFDTGFFPIQVLNTVLGGSFSSLLNLNLREKRGYSYGASSGFDMRLTPGPSRHRRASRPIKHPSR